jgi:PIN domain nuclease of toxin-antitoxin system
VDVQGMLEDLQALGMKVESFLPQDGDRAGRLWAPTRPLGLSLGDRACPSLGMRLGLMVLTWDRAWAQLPLDVVIQLLR